ncbi:MAG: hypothetical protein H0W90_10610 [Actinobacteria bacterium]|nr:hypothetical protein [Actinomycetota bacterium]
MDIPSQHQAEVDGWLPKHFDDSLRHDAVTSVACYEILRDWQSEGLPALFNRQANRFIPYVATDLASLIDWVDSPILKDAIEDGVERENVYPWLDDEPFNGSIMEVVQVCGTIAEDFADGAPILVERFHVDPATADAFDEWLNGPYMQQVGMWPAVTRVRTFQAASGIPQRWPYNRYQGKGNRMIWVDFERETNIIATTRDDTVSCSFSESVQWDLRLPYVVRDAGRQTIRRTKADVALA